jgi:hypothetical protein
MQQPVPDRSTGTEPQKLLERVLAYRNAEVVARFLEMYPIGEEESEELFVDTLRWLYLKTFRQENDELFLVLPSEMFLLDEMWHCFVLDTPGYATFCLEHFGHFVHHQPETAASRSSRRALATTDPEGYIEERTRRLEGLSVVIVRNLGESVRHRWLEELPAKYPPQRMLRLRAMTTLTVRPPPLVPVHAGED